MREFRHLAGTVGSEHQLMSAKDVEAREPDPPSTKGQDTTGLDDPHELAPRLAALEARVNGLQAPTGRCQTAIGGAAAVAIGAVAYVLLPFMQDDPALPRFVHQRFLHTDRALVSTLGAEAADAMARLKDEPPLWVGLRTVIETHLTGSSDEAAYLSEVVRGRQENLYHASKFFRRRDIELRLGCLAARDRFIRDRLLPNLTAEEAAAWCDARVEPLVVHAPDEPAFVLPFMASGDDDVTLYVEVSDALREAGFRPHRFVEVSLGEEPVLLPRTGPILNRVEVDLPVEGERGIRYATLALSEKGFERLNAGEVIGVSAVVQVRRER